MTAQRSRNKGMIFIPKCALKSILASDYDKMLMIDMMPDYDMFVTEMKKGKMVTKGQLKLNEKGEFELV